MSKLDDVVFTTNHDRRVVVCDAFSMCGGKVVMLEELRQGSLGAGPYVSALLEPAEVAKLIEALGGIVPHAEAPAPKPEPPKFAVGDRVKVVSVPQQALANRVSLGEVLVVGAIRTEDIGRPARDFYRLRDVHGGGWESIPEASLELVPPYQSKRGDFVKTLGGRFAVVDYHNDTSADLYYEDGGYESYVEDRTLLPVDDIPDSIKVRLLKHLI